MLPLASDADVHGDIVRGLRRRLPAIDLLRVQDVLGSDAPDSEVLSWVSAERRILITNDRSTMIGLAIQRVEAGESIPGLIATSNRQSIGSAIEDILLVAEYMSEQELRDRVVVYLPLRE